MRKRSYLIAALIVVLPLLAPHRALAAEQATLDQYQTRLQKLQTLVKGCEAQAAACNAKEVGDDQQVQLRGLGSGANVDAFEARYDWLRKTLDEAKNPNEKLRADLLQSAEARLQAASREAAGAGPEKVDLKVARQKADKILDHQEFETVHSNSIWARVGAHIGKFLDRFFNHVAQFGKRAPWIGPVMEWGLIGLAIAGLLVWAMRVMRRQRLAIRVEADRQAESWEEAARNWRDLADQEAARGDWREAVHSMYWASIAMLEGRRLWAANRARTPREYLRLLEEGSENWKLLRQQTSGFEHIWYGQHDASPRDFERAVELHRGLRA
jgi:hypothetical protein